MNEEVMSKEAEVIFLKAVSWNLPRGNENYEKPNPEHLKSKGYGSSNPWDMGLLSACVNEYCLHKLTARNLTSVTIYT
jgi:hypothetical protein